MTSNQISFANVKEAIRHNKETEKQGRFSMKENKRHNLASEKYYTGTLSENMRHNRATEYLTQDQIVKNYTVGMTNADAAQINAHSNMHKAISAADKDTAIADSTRRAQARDDEKWDLQSELDRQKNVQGWLDAIGKLGGIIGDIALKQGVK